MADDDKNEKRSETDKLAGAQQALAKAAKEREALLAEKDSLAKAKAESEAREKALHAEIERLKAAVVAPIGTRCISKSDITDSGYKEVTLPDGTKTMHRYTFLVVKRGEVMPFDPKKPSGLKTFTVPKAVGEGDEEFTVDFSKGYSGLIQGQHYEFR